METLTTKAKALVAIVGAALTAVLGVLAPDTQLFQVLTIAAALCTAIGVYLTPNAVPSDGKHEAVAATPETGV